MPVVKVIVTTLRFTAELDKDNNIMRLITIFGLILSLVSCQKEFNGPQIQAPVAVLPPPITPQVSAIVVTNGTTVEYDSIVYKYFTDKTLEIHHNYFGDSTIRSYYYDAEGKLYKLDDDKAIYYTNNNAAKSIKFNYDNSGNLIETITDFKNVYGVKAYYKHTTFRGAKSIIIYDTAYKSSAYDLDWVNRIIYNAVNADNTIIYDSCIYYNYKYGHVKTKVSSYSFDAGKTVKAINNFIYHDMILAEAGTTNIVRDLPAPMYQALRKNLYHNLANWYPTSSAMQDDRYQLFSIPGGMYKSIDYTGISTTVGAMRQDVKRSYTYENDYHNNVLINSIVTYTMSGQGNAKYSFMIRYYYK